MSDRQTNGEATASSEFAAIRSLKGGSHRNRDPHVGLRPLLTLDEVADLLGVSKAWVRDHSTRRQPRLPVVRLGGKRAVLRFRPQDVERFINENLVAPKEKAQ